MFDFITDELKRLESALIAVDQMLDAYQRIMAENKEMGKQIEDLRKQIYELKEKEDDRSSKQH